jgi:hypothetical protein
MSEGAAAIATKREEYQHGNLIYRSSLEGQSCPNEVKSNVCCCSQPLSRPDV